MTDETPAASSTQPSASSASTPRRRNACSPHFADKDQKAKWFGDPSTPPTSGTSTSAKGAGSTTAANIRRQTPRVRRDLPRHRRKRAHRPGATTCTSDGVKLSSSLTVVELTAVDGGTRTDVHRDGRVLRRPREAGSARAGHRLDTGCAGQVARCSWSSNEPKATRIETISGNGLDTRRFAALLDRLLSKVASPWASSTSSPVTASTAFCPAGRLDRSGAMTSGIRPESGSPKVAIRPSPGAST